MQTKNWWFDLNSKKKVTWDKKIAHMEIFLKYLSVYIKTMEKAQKYARSVCFRANSAVAPTNHDSISWIPRNQTTDNKNAVRDKHRRAERDSIARRGDKFYLVPGHQLYHANISYIEGGNE